jgi:glycosyltransferase involved in cell wall biosynthesis
MCTVLLIAYNHEPYIRLAIESVVSQKTQYLYKIHIFDDGSTDGTGDIIREYAKQYPDLIVPFIAEKNMGAQQNIWNAYTSVDTKYAAFLECDDYWCDEEKLQLQIDALEQNPDCSFCAHNTVYMNINDAHRQKENGKLFVINRNVLNTGKYSSNDFKPLSEAGWANHNNSRLIRMSCVDLDGLTDKENFLYDNAQFFYLLQRGYLYFIQRVMSVYIMSMSSTFTSMQVEQKVRVHVEKMLSINIGTNREFERLIFTHIASFVRYWYGIKINIRLLLLRYLKKLFLDVHLHHKLKKMAKENIKQLQRKAAEKVLETRV